MSGCLLPHIELGALAQAAAVLMHRDTVDTARRLDAIISAHLLSKRDWRALLSRVDPSRDKATRIVSVAAENTTCADIAAVDRNLHEELDMER